MGIDLAAFLRVGALVSTAPGCVWIASNLSCSPVPSHRGRSLYAPDFFLDSAKPWWLPDQDAQMSREQLREALLEFPSRPWDVSSPVPPSLSLFQNAVQEIQAGIRLQRWTKVVPVIFSLFQTCVGLQERAWALTQMLSLPPTLGLYGVWDDHSGILGATPEWLFDLDGLTLSTMALAGTRRPGSDQPSLLDDPKQILEHQLVVDDLAQVLTPVADVVIGDRQVLQVPSLEHLLTPIRARLRKPIPFDLIARRLHPTPALGASPRGSADSFLRKLNEQSPRARFGAPFGWCDDTGRGACLVAIRNVQWQASQARIGGGCGIIQASRLQEEWAELLAKLRSVQDNLGI